jgi:hypothetical protein
LASAHPLLRKQFVLALIIGLHLLAVMAWLQEKRPRIDRGTTLITILLRPPTKAAVPSPDRTIPSIHRTPIIKPARRISGQDIAPAVASPSTAGANRADAPPDTSVSAPAASPGAGFNMDLVRRQASRVARAIARELPSVPSRADSAWARFGRDVDAAHYEAGVWQDSYTAADGTIIYRKHVGGRTICRMSGNVGPENGVIKGIDEAGLIACPSRAQWKREP